MICVLCGRAARLHESCVLALDARLQRIPELYIELAEALEPGSTDNLLVSGTQTPLPVALQPLSLQCRGGIVSILATWETDWRERRGLSVVPARAHREQLLEGPRILLDVVAFLRTHLDWAAKEHPAVDEFADEVSDIIGACRSAIGDVVGHLQIGRCPAQLGERTCGRVLYADPTADEIRCDRCGTAWPKARWPLLATMIAETAA